MSNIFVAGHKGMVGSAILKRLNAMGENTIFVSRAETDLLDQAKVREFFDDNKIDQVYLAAAKVGGIFANDTYPAQFIYENLMIQNNVIHQSFLSGVDKLLFLGSSCIYPRLAKQPIKESSLLAGPLEPTNEPYALAKISGIKMCESYNRQYGTDYRSIMPTNLYGPGDNFHEKNSHVIPALIRRLHQAKSDRSQEIVAWGTGSALREFLHVDDLATASIFLMNLDSEVYENAIEPRLSHINVGAGEELSIKELILIISEIIGFRGTIVWDKSKPDGSPRKLMDSSKIFKLGWKPNYDLRTGIKETYEWFLKNASKARN